MSVLVSDSFSYDPAGNLTSQTDYDGQVTNFDYDQLNRRIDEKWMSGMTVLRTISYGYDAASQLLTASDPDSAYTYGYDQLGRPVTVDNTERKGDASRSWPQADGNCLPSVG